MKIYDLVRYCLANLWKRKLRTLLTTLGVAIGTTSIVIMISLGVGLEKSQMESMSEWMDLTTIEVYNYNNISYDQYGNPTVEPGQLVLDDAFMEKLNQMEHVVAATAKGSMPLWGTYPAFRITSGRYGYNNNVVVMDTSMLKALGYELSEGRWPKEGEENVILFGEEAAHYFYNMEVTDYAMGPEYDENGNIKDPKVDPLSSRITITPQYNQVEYDNETGEEYLKPGAPSELRQFKANVVGVLKADAKNYETYNSIFISFDFYHTLMKEYNKINGIRNTGTSSYETAFVKVDDMNNVAAVQEYITNAGFDTWSAEEYLAQSQETMNNIQMVLGALGGVSMLVAAIGIANTMVMSIYERTREIGVMKVIGCKLNDIRMMFLIEAACIGMIGGVIGIGVSYGLSLVINHFLGGMMGYGNSAISYIPLWLVALGFLFSVGVGIISGFYPAQRAVKISALAAIRQE
ncbi:MAG: ABC transporter permease [Erysipelotrichaceae bacterium]|nr:ABC transporter permease [Erysipelotrichaceae bacterium]